MVVYREMVTPDGTKLISRHRHDYQAYTDKNGKYYMLDGGLNSGYYRRSANGDEKIVEVTTNDNFELIRIHFARYNRFTRTYVNLCDINNDWLQNIIDYYIDNGYKKEKLFYLFLEEKIYRAENEIYVPGDNNLVEYDF